MLIVRGSYFTLHVYSNKFKGYIYIYIYIYIYVYIEIKNIMTKFDIINK